MKKIIVFYSHNFGGLGHNKRLSLIIRELLLHFGEKYNCLVINSGEKQDFLFENIKGLKIINLPTYKIENYKLIGDYKCILKSRQAIFQKIFSLNTEIEKLIIEHYPFGRNFLDGEIRSLIKMYRHCHKKGRVFSSVRDVIDLRALDGNNLNLFDRFLIHGDRNIINYDDYFTKGVNNKIIYTGYVIDHIRKDGIKKENIIYVNIGGGQDGVNYVSDFLQKFNSIKTKLDYKIIVCLGGNYSGDNIDLLVKIYSGNIEFYKYLDNSIELKIKSIFVVSMGGYNNMIESLKYNIQSIIYPRLSDNEQQERLLKFQGVSSNFYNGFNTSHEDMVNLLANEKKDLRLGNVNFDGAHFSSNLIVNFNKYTYIKIRVTNACNAKCDMCGVIKRNTSYNKMEKLQESILDFFRLGGSVVNFTGGEPTIYKGFWDLLKFSKNLGLVTSVSTNGSTLGEVFFDALFDKGIRLIDYMDISIDGLGEKQDIRRNYKGLFEVISKSLPKLLDFGIFIHINVTVRRDNIGEMRDIFHYFKDMGVNSISFGMMSNSPINDTSYLIPEINKIKKFYLEEKKYIINNSGKMSVKFSPDFISGDFKKFISSIYNKNQFYKETGRKCNFISSKKELRINENGNISPCCVLDDFDEGLGNINNRDLLSIVCSEDYEIFLNKKFPDISKACLNCNLETYE